jgi:hypothetical protein
MGFPSLAELRRQRAEAETDIASAQAGGDAEALRMATKQRDCVAWLAECVYPMQVEYWLDALVTSYGEDPTDVRAGLQHSIREMERGRLDALIRGDQVAAERGAEGKAFLAKRLAQLSRAEPGVALSIQSRPCGPAASRPVPPTRSPML